MVRLFFKLIFIVSFLRVIGILIVVILSIFGIRFIPAARMMWHILLIFQPLSSHLLLDKFWLNNSYKLYG